MNNLKAYHILKAESATVGWPVSYRTDLTKHDLNDLRRKDAPKRFGWILRRHGTWLIKHASPWTMHLILYSPISDGAENVLHYIYETMASGHLRLTTPQTLAEWVTINLPMCPVYETAITSQGWHQNGTTWVNQFTNKAILIKEMVGYMYGYTFPDRQKVAQPYSVKVWERRAEAFWKEQYPIVQQQRYQTKGVQSCTATV